MKNLKTNLAIVIAGLSIGAFAHAKTVHCRGIITSPTEAAGQGFLIDSPDGDQLSYAQQPPGVVRIPFFMKVTKYDLDGVPSAVVKATVDARGRDGDLVNLELVINRERRDSNGIPATVTVHSTSLRDVKTTTKGTGDCDIGD